MLSGLGLPGKWAGAFRIAGAFSVISPPRCVSWTVSRPTCSSAHFTRLQSMIGLQGENVFSLPRPSASVARGVPPSALMPLSPPFFPSILHLLFYAVSALRPLPARPFFRFHCKDAILLFAWSVCMCHRVPSSGVLQSPLAPASLSRMPPVDAGKDRPLHVHLTGFGVRPPPARFHSARRADLTSPLSPNRRPIVTSSRLTAPKHLTALPERSRQPVVARRPAARWSGLDRAAGAARPGLF